MSTEKEQNQTKENQFRLQKYVWWPWSTKVRVIVIAIVTLAFFLGTTIRIERRTVGGKGDNIQWLVDWMKSPESQNKLMIRCEKVNDHELRCTKEPEEGNSHAENSKQSQRFFLRLDDLKGDQNQSENSLCCHPCRHSPSKASTYHIVFTLERYKKIYDWLIYIINKGTGGIIVECKYHSVTLSEKFEYELKRMLEYELQLLQKNTEFQKLIPKCKTNLFMTDFHNILSETLKEVQKNSTTMSKGKEQNQTKENQFRLQKWWPWSTKVRVIAVAIVTLAFFLGTTVKIKPHIIGDQEGDNIQWLVDWMKSPESQKKSMNLRCKKVNDELRCTREPEEGNGHAENSKQSQRFFLRLDDLKGHQNHSENSLCCRPCRHSRSNDSTSTIVFTLERYKKIYDWVLQIIKKIIGGQTGPNTGNIIKQTGPNTTDDENTVKQTGPNTTGTVKQTGPNTTDNGNIIKQTGPNTTDDENTVKQTGPNTTGPNTTDDGNTVKQTGLNTTDNGNIIKQTGPNTTDDGNTVKQTGLNTTDDTDDGNNVEQSGPNTTDDRNTIKQTGPNITDDRNIVEDDCKHHSVTLSNKFEYELKRMLEYELQLLQKNTEFQKLIFKCKTNLFETKFHEILSKTLKEVYLEKSIHSTEQVIFTSEVEQKEELSR